MDKHVLSIFQVHYFGLFLDKIVLPKLIHGRKVSLVEVIELYRPNFLLPLRHPDVVVLVIIFEDVVYKYFQAFKHGFSFASLFVLDHRYSDQGLVELVP